MSTTANGKVFRVRNLPHDVDRLEVRDMLHRYGEGMRDSNIRVFSLAGEVDRTSHLSTQTATITFEPLPACLEARPSHADFTIDVFPQKLPLIIDEHFQGVTPLNNVPDHEHTHE